MAAPIIPIAITAASAAASALGKSAEKKAKTPAQEEPVETPEEALKIQKVAKLERQMAEKPIVQGHAVEGPDAPLEENAYSDAISDYYANMEDPTRQGVYNATRAIARKMLSHNPKKVKVVD